MALPVIGLIKALFKPAADLIDDLTLSKEEKLLHQATIAQLEAGVLAQVIDYQRALDEARAKVIMSEATGESWLQRNWRPCVMLMFAYIVLNNYVLGPYFGLPSLEVPPDLWDLIKLGLGGYVVGRSVEKAAKNWKTVQGALGGPGQEGK